MVGLITIIPELAPPRSFSPPYRTGTPVDFWADWGRRHWYMLGSALFCRRDYGRQDFFLATTCLFLFRARGPRARRLRSSSQASKSARKAPSWLCSWSSNADDAALRDIPSVPCRRPSSAGREGGGSALQPYPYAARKPASAHAPSQPAHSRNPRHVATLLVDRNQKMGYVHR